MTKIKAILFDMDGVLIDAKEWAFRSFKSCIGFVWTHNTLV